MEVGNTTQEQRRAREEDQAQRASSETAGGSHRDWAVNERRNVAASAASASASAAMATVQQVSPDQYATYRQEGSAVALKMQIYARDNDSQTHQFESKEAANAFAWDEYKKMHPDASEQAHVDSGWDAFKRGFTDTVSNPVGQTVSQIGKWAGSSPETQKELYKAGGNPLGFTGKELAGAAGASDVVQDKVEQVGKTAESATPVWGQARFYGGAVADAAKGKPPTLELTQNVMQDAKSGAGITPIVGAAAGAKAVGTAPSPAVEVGPNAGEQRRAPPKSAGTPGFNPPRRLEDGRIGYPLSPTSPPKLPDATPSSSQAGHSEDARARPEATAMPQAAASQTARTEERLAGTGNHRFVEDGQQPSTSAGGATAREDGFLVPPVPAERRTGGAHGRLASEARQRMADFMRKYPKVTDPRVAEIFRVSKGTVSTVRDEFGIQKTAGPGVRVPDAKLAEVADVFRGDPSARVTEVARRHGVSTKRAYAIQRDVREKMRTASGEDVMSGVDFDAPLTAGQQQEVEHLKEALPVVKRGKSSRLGAAEKQRVIQHLRDNARQSNAGAGEALNLSQSTIARYRHREGLIKTSGGGVPTSRERMNEIAADIGRNPQLSDTTLGERNHISRPTIAKIRREYGLPTRLDARAQKITQAEPRAPVAYTAGTQAPVQAPPQIVPEAPIPAQTSPAQTSTQHAPPSPSALSDIMSLDELRGFDHEASYPSGASPAEPPSSPVRAPGPSVSNEAVITWMQSNVEHALIDQILALPQEDFSAHIGYYRELMELERQA